MKLNGYKVRFKMARYVNNDRLYVGLDCCYLRVRFDIEEIERSMKNAD